MEDTDSTMTTLMENVEAYGKTSLELLKLQSVDKTALLATGFLSRMLFVPVLLLLAFSLTIAGGLFIGELLGQTYQGFLIVALCYTLVAIVLLFVHSAIKSGINNSIIKQLLK